MKRKIGIFAVIAVAASLAYAAQRAADIEVGSERWMQNGATAFISRVNAAGQLEVWENVNLSTNVFTIDDNVGDVKLRSATSTQLLTLAPSAIHTLIVNSSTGNLCISTGTGAGAYVYVTTSAVVAGRISCYN